MSYEETRQLVDGRTLTFPGLGQSTYRANGAYTFSHEGQTVTRFGFFEVRRDGKVCVDLQDWDDRCDMFVRQNGLLFLLTQEGNRFPVMFGVEMK